MIQSIGRALARWPRGQATAAAARAPTAEEPDTEPDPPGHGLAAARQRSARAPTQS